ncbi:iron-containing alcohol dehydrogenase [Veillonella sp. T11011-6]|uniref:iron-containing alcohol dehydrogenase n=1 Tax=Veillonella sp. T11011-6 TaxID=2027459 RepID=UPI000CF3CB93|nr:iron-containing alcohol dehydrogenase [Veillonella sp. T11011-6]PQL10083.1 NADH-dependent alcohol dehydrogenase [Veillonella sp. T11011-6]
MFNFDFYNPTHIVFGKDRLSELNALVPKDAKVLITYGGGSAVRSGLIDRIVAALGSRKVEQFGGIEPNPSLETCERAVAFIKEHGVDFVLAVGGGSVVDATKLIVMGATYDGPVIEVMKAGVPEVPVEMVPNPLPFGTVMTLPATGSEMNNGAVITYGDGKFPVFSSLVFPKFSMLDPTLTFTLPEKQVKNGVIDTFVHTTEQYLTYPVDGRIQDRFSEGILKTMIEIGKETVENPENYDVRANHVWASTLALNGLIGAGVPQDWATHLIGHELTAVYHLDHGITLAIVLPALLEVKKADKLDKLAQYATRVWHITEGTKEEKADKAIAKTREFFESLGVSTHLKDYGLGAEAVDKIVKQLEDHGMTRLGEKGDVTPEVAREILMRAL